MKRREWVATQIRATLANGGPIHGSTLVAWAKELDEHGAYSDSDHTYVNRTYLPEYPGVTVYFTAPGLVESEVVASTVAWAIKG